MDARETWQALQTRLTAARAAVDAGDRERAIAEITAALDIDPNFLAAHSLRERILSVDEPPATVPPVMAQPAVPVIPAEAPAPGAVDGYAKFEQRAKRRRVDRRMDAARSAISSGRLRAAASALDEVIELDPNLPELPALTAQFDDLRRTTAAARRGPRLVAAGVFLLTILGASWLQDSTSIIAPPMIASAPVPEAPARDVEVVVHSDIHAVATAGTTSAYRDAPAESAIIPVGTEVTLPQAPETENPIEITPLRPAATSVTPATTPMLRPVSPNESAAIVPMVPIVSLAAIETPALPAVVDVVDDRALVTQALQRYRHAYDELDPQSAQAVWPAVNLAALTRAFDGLESQNLTFDACNVDVRGEAATATCQGSARYVPKIGSHEPRTEPRVWNFTLRKAANDWKIDSARAER